MTVLADPLMPGTSIVLREAVSTDVGPIVALLATDQLGASREEVGAAVDLQPYRTAFEAIAADPAHLLVVASDGPEVVATLQLSVLPGMARRGASRAQLEAIRVRADCRGGGVGSALIGWAVGESRRRGCALVQLTSDVSRVDAHRFYERLGFVASHQGFKLHL